MLKMYMTLYLCCSLYDKGWQTTQRMTYDQCCRVCAHDSCSLASQALGNHHVHRNRSARMATEILAEAIGSNGERSLPTDLY